MPADATTTATPTVTVDVIDDPAEATRDVSTRR
jgi:hypothetical protein